MYRILNSIYSYIEGSSAHWRGKLKFRESVVTKIKKDLDKVQ